jgi:hypothetical protein
MHRRWVLGLVTLYGALWLLTTTVGRWQVGSEVLSAIRDTVARAAPGQRSSELPSTNVQGARPPYYYVDVTVPCPFLLRVQRGYQIAPLWGSGADEWYVWIFGFKFIIARPMVWFS